MTQNSLPITLCGWLYLSSQKNDWATPFGNTNRNNTSAYSFRMDINTFRINNWYSWQDRFVKTFELQQRYCVVMTIKQWETKVYVNWNLEATFNNWQQWSYMWPFHMFFWHGQYYFNQWWWRQFAIYNKILSESEALKYYRNTQ